MQGPSKAPTPRCPGLNVAPPALLQALAPRALLLVRLLLAGVVGALPPARQQEITDVLYAILKVRRLQLVARQRPRLRRTFAFAFAKGKAKTTHLQLCLRLPETFVAAP